MTSRRRIPPKTVVGEYTPDGLTGGEMLLEVGLKDADQVRAIWARCAGSRPATNLSAACPKCLGAGKLGFKGQVWRICPECHGFARIYCPPQRPVARLLRRHGFKSAQHLADTIRRSQCSAN